MIKVTSNITYNNEHHCVEVGTRVLVGTENNACKDCRDKILKAELKALISSLVEKQPDLLFSAMEEVITEGLIND